MRIRNKIIIILLLIGLFASISSASAFFGFFESEPKLETFDNITDVHLLEEGEPAYTDGFFVAIQNGTEVYYLYQADVIALSGDFNQSFKAEVERNQTVGLNTNANIIMNVYDMNGNKLSE
ncbi:hypothetical protein [Methanobrevibacter sp.]|uniref:hypothetical protein n=1 Tax=Methanobrevibacter sp. TaxID=66852 RepID=UPI0026046092|nr:hypothetical protein [uncultured Methanobrevibacter sp.]